MEGTQESSSSKPLTKSSRKRLRKRQAAALEKFILASEAAGSCKIEPLPDSNPESVEIRGCLSNIVFHNNSPEKECFFVSNNSPCDVLNTKAKSVCCEGHENISLENNLDTKQESVVPRSKRKRNGKKPFNSEVSSDNPGDAIVSKCQKSFETQFTQHHLSSQKDCPKPEKSALSSLNHSIGQVSPVAQNIDSKKVEAADKLNVTDFKQQEETGDKASTLSRSKRRRNRKKAITLSENSDPQDQSVDKGIKSQEVPECSPQLVTDQLSPQKDSSSEQKLYINPPTSINSGQPESGTIIYPVKNNSLLKCTETAVGKVGKDIKKESKPQVSTLPENLDDIGKKACDLSCKSPSEQKKGIIVKEHQVDNKSKHLEVVSKSGSCEFQKEQSRSSLAFQSTGVCSPDILSVGTGTHPTGMEGAHKNISKIGQVPKESSNKDKSKVTYFSKCGPSAKKAAPVCYDEVDRSSVTFGPTEIHSLPESDDKCFSTSKNRDLKGKPEIMRNMVSKGSSVIRKVDPAQVSTLPENLGDISNKTSDHSCKSPDEQKKGIIVKEHQVDNKSKHLEVVSKQSQSSLAFQNSGDCSPDILSVGSVNHPTGTEGAHKNISKVEQVPEEGSNKDKGKSRVTYFSKCGPSTKKAAPVCYDEVDRSSVTFGPTEIHPLPESDDKCFSASKNRDVKGKPEIMSSMVSKGSSVIRKVDPAQVSTFPENLGDVGKKTCDSSEQKIGIIVKENQLDNKSKHLEVVSTSDSCKWQEAQSQSSLVFESTGDCSPDILSVGTGNHPTSMEGAHKNISKVEQVPKESSDKDKGKSKVVCFSKGLTAKKSPVFYDEDNRTSATLGLTEINSLPKDEIIMNVVSKGFLPFRNVQAELREVANKSVAQPDSLRIEEKSEQLKKCDVSAGASPDAADKLKEKVKAEREARKTAKLEKKQKSKPTAEVKEATEAPSNQSSASTGYSSVEKKVVKLTEGEPRALPLQVSKVDEKTSTGKSKAELKAERRAKQEAQRAAKTAATLNIKATPAQGKVKTAEQGISKAIPLKGSKTSLKQPMSNLKGLRKEQGAKLLSRLGWGDGRMKRSTSEDNTLKETKTIHPAIVQLSTRFTDRIISGSNARCLAFVQAIKKAIVDYQTPPQKELGRDLEARLLTPSLAYLESQRPHAVSVLNATKFLKWQLTQLQPLQQCTLENSSVPHLETKKAAIISDEEAKKNLIEGLDAYIWEKIEVAERAVCDTLRDKIKDGDVILTYGCSYLLQQILTGAQKSGTKFKVVVVDGRPWREGREMLRCLVAVGIPCSYVLLSAASSVMRQVNKVLLGAHALLSNGYVMSRVGVSQVALLASAHNVPVLVACETHKFCERVQSDSFVYNEMGEPDGLAQLLGGEDGPLSNWRSIPSLSLLNLSYDVTPPELVTAVATELAVLPCTSVPVVLRVRPAEPISRH